MNTVPDALPPPGATSVERHRAEGRRLARWSAGVLLVGVLPLVAWLAFAPLSSAVIAQAHVKVDQDLRPVQHLEGGVVREVKVRNGQQVRQGEPLLVLGDVAVDADVGRIRSRVHTELASLARLEAEQLNAPAIRFPDEVAQQARRDPTLSAQLAKESELFLARRQPMLAQLRLLEQQRAKLGEEKTAWQAQITQAGESLRHQRTELEINTGLSKDGFVSPTRIAQLSAAVEDYRVKLEEKRSELARTEQRMVDTELRMASLQAEYRQQASDQAKATAARLMEVRQELRKAVDASSRQVIAAPAAGEVVNLRVTSPGAVVTPREAIADIVPSQPRLLLEAHVRPEDVARVRKGQAASVRLTAFPYRSTRWVDGKVSYVAGDRSIDRNTGAPYFVAHIEPEAGSLARAGDGVSLQAGMPAEVYVEGEQRTPLEYLIEPVTQVLRHAGREP